MAVWAGELASGSSSVTFTNAYSVLSCQVCLSKESPCSCLQDSVVQHSAARARDTENRFFMVLEFKL